MRRKLIHGQSGHLRDQECIARGSEGHRGGPVPIWQVDRRGPDVQSEEDSKRTQVDDRGQGA